MLQINDQLSIPLKEFSFSFARSGGPGGQNVNKVNSKVTLRWPLTESSLPEDIKQRFREKYARRINLEDELVVTSQRFRDQGRNVADCLRKLQELLLAVATPPRKRKPTRPTRGSRQRRLEDKKRRSERKRLRQTPRWE